MIYSKRIFLFINDIKTIIKGILAKEVRLKVRGERFYDKTERYSYPIKVVIYNNKSMLGYFESDFYELGFHKKLMHIPRAQLENIVRHEIAHYLTFIQYGAGVQPHAAEFRRVCREIGWGPEVFQACLALEEADALAMNLENPILRKVEKLMALASSSNQNEAEQALIKSQQLLMKHNLASAYISGDDSEEMVVKRLLKQKRENAKMRAIARILETFFVSTVYVRGADHIYLEILGTPVNIEIAEYVAHILEHDLERLWEDVQRSANLKGMVARNSFFLGIAKGYCLKIHSLMRGCQSDESHGLMVIEKQLKYAREMVYSHLTSKKSYASHCAASAALGEKMGKQLQINPALRSSAISSSLLIGVS